MIAIIDYGVGNINSIKNMLRKVSNKEIVFVSRADELNAAEKFILPGVGAFDSGMRALNCSGMRKELDRQIMDLKKPILGICLGMQMLGTKSEEGVEEGLGYLDFTCRKFDFSTNQLKVPHMGWDYVEVVNDCDLLFQPIDDLRFYFVHSYYATCSDQADVMLSCDYGMRFASAVHKDNVYGVQFHPEKSHKYGKWLLDNFANRV